MKLSFSSAFLASVSIMLSLTAKVAQAVPTPQIGTNLLPGSSGLLSVLGSTSVVEELVDTVEGGVSTVGSVVENVGLTNAVAGLVHA